MKKFTVISIVSVFLIIPMFFGVYIEYFIAREREFLTLIPLIFGVLVFMLITKIVNTFGYNQKSIDLMRKHNVIDALLHKNQVILWFLFPLTIIMEELIFRYYLISFLFSTLQLNIILAIVLSSISFSLYHIHIWFYFKDVTILGINLSYTLLLGLFNGYIFFTFGIIPCIIIHYLIAFYSYYDLYNGYFKNNEIEKK
ncbi:MAG: CPBP family intramembrane glutamic endopeptidase [Promethearchaeota archaeon]